MPTSIEEYLQGLTHHFKQPLAHLSSLFVKISVLAMMKEKVESHTLAPLAQEGEHLIQHMGMVFRDFEIFKHFPPLNEKIDFKPLANELSLHYHINIDPSCYTLCVDSNPLLFPHVITALVDCHSHFIEGDDPITLRYEEENTIFITREANGWDQKTIKKVFYPFFDKKVKAPHWDLSIIHHIITTSLQGEVSAFTTSTTCGFKVTLP